MIQCPLALRHLSSLLLLLAPRRNDPRSSQNGSLRRSPHFLFVPSSSRAARRGFPPCPRTRGYPVRDLLPSGGKDRLQALEAKAFQKKIGPGGEQGHYFFDISQNAGFTTMACAIPRPCTNSDIWSQRRDGPVLPHELLAAQGFAAWLFKSIHIQLVSN